MPSLPKKFSRRQFLAAVGLAGLGSAGYVRWWEPEWLEVGRHEVTVRKSQPRAPLKILQLSDLHASPVVSLDFIAQAVALGLQQEPDLICLTGDFISHKFDAFDEYTRVLAPLGKCAPVFACLGNHDGGWWSVRGGGYADTSHVVKLLADSGITLLHNRTTTLTVRDWNLQLVGLGDFWSGQMMPGVAFGAAKADTDVTVLLSHNPDTKTFLKPFAWNLMLCGHTHGGQVRLPYFGTPFAPVRDKNFVQGLHRWEERWIHITKGVGNLHGIRFNCRPEVSLLTLV